MTFYLFFMLKKFVIQCDVYSKWSGSEYWTTSPQIMSHHRIDVCATHGKKAYIGTLNAQCNCLIVRFNCLGSTSAYSTFIFILHFPYSYTRFTIKMVQICSFFRFFILMKYVRFHKCCLFISIIQPKTICLQKKNTMYWMTYKFLWFSLYFSVYFVYGTNCWIWILYWYQISH